MRSLSEPVSNKTIHIVVANSRVAAWTWALWQLGAADVAMTDCAWLKYSERTHRWIPCHELRPLSFRLCLIIPIWGEIRARTYERTHSRVWSMLQCPSTEAQKPQIKPDPHEPPCPRGPFWEANRSCEKRVCQPARMPVRRLEWGNLRGPATVHMKSGLWFNGTGSNAFGSQKICKWAANLFQMWWIRNLGIN